MRIFIKTFLVFAIAISCKDQSSPSPSDAVSSVFFSNASDPRFLEVTIKEEGTITFYGKKSGAGAPLSLSGYRFRSLKDVTVTGNVQLDDSGRYSKILLDSGEGLVIDYGTGDFAQVSFFTKDSLINTIAIKTSRPVSRARINDENSHSRLLSDNQSGNYYFDVVLENRKNGSRSKVGPDEGGIFMDIIHQSGKVTIAAEYDADKQFYYVPIPSTGLSYKNDDLVTKVIVVIKSTIPGACANPDSQDPARDKNIFQLISSSVCPIPHPVAKLICEGSVFINFVCAANTTADFLDPLLGQTDQHLAKIDPIYISDPNPKVILRAHHIKYGSFESGELTYDELREPHPAGFHYRMVFSFLPPRN